MDVEIKVNFTGGQIEQAEKAFGLDREGKDRRIWFGEVVTGHDGRGALPLLGRGVILRVRTKKRDAGDVTLKLRGPDGGIDEAAWKCRVATLADAKIEGDWADRRLVSASVTADFGRTERAALDAGTATITGLLSAAQRKLAHEELFVPVGAVRLLGPITARKWDPEPGDDVAAERWSVGDLEFLEISVVAEDEPERAQEELLRRVRHAGLTVEEGEPKTTRVLRHLACEAG